MSPRPDAAEQRKLRSIARRYERDGYRVTVPGRGGAVPAFLDGITPDLIAESERDHVVVEIKRSDAVRGANDLVEIAERVSGREGWRFELVTLPPLPDEVPLDPKAWEAVDARVRRAASLGLTDLAYAHALAALEALLADLSLRHGLAGARTPPERSARDLLSLGLVSGDDLDRIDRARSVRNRLLHAAETALPSVADVEALLALARRISGETAAAP